MQKISYKTQKMIYFSCIAAGLLFLWISFYNYNLVAGSTVPIMDFWEWIYKFGIDSWEGNLSFSQLYSDSGVHSQPLILYLYCKVFCTFGFNMRVCIYSGTIILMLLSAAVISFFLYQSKNSGHWILRGLIVFLIAGAILNYNSWELLTEPFVMGTAIRCVSYYGLFGLTGRLLSRYYEIPALRRRTYLVILVSSYIFVALMISGAYFVALLGAFIVGCVIFIYMDDNYRKKESWIIVFLSLAVTLIIGVIYLSHAGAEAGTSPNALQNISINGKWFLGVLTMLGASLLHQNLYDSYGSILYYVVGGFLLVAVIVAVVFFFKKKIFKKGFFPLLCLVYAGLNVAVIAAGRVNRFSVAYLSSSRYAVETSFGLIGLLWLLYEILTSFQHSQNCWCRLAIGLIAIGMLTGLFTGMRIETGIAPYRQIYNQRLETMMIDLDAYTDEELAPFQSQSLYVRESVDFLRKNQLSVFED